MTQWFAEGLERVHAKKYARWRYFEKTCCLVTVDGSRDHLIQPEGLKGYTFPRVATGSAEQKVPNPYTDQDSDVSLDEEEFDYVASSDDDVPIIKLKKSN
eukprot:Lithocolla_globosa_v1_NODE_4115_length_1507_cov_6.719008.p1 type:complete len:100 gc:universal NODE_4115_length_1507_cov_6.719008:1109-1408(+)